MDRNYSSLTVTNSKLDKLKLTAFPYLSPRTSGEGLKKEWNQIC